MWGLESKQEMGLVVVYGYVPHRYHWIQRTCSERGLEWKQEMATQISLDSVDVF